MIGWKSCIFLTASSDMVDTIMPEISRNTIRALTSILIAHTPRFASISAICA